MLCEIPRQTLQAAAFPCSSAPIANRLPVLLFRPFSAVWLGFLGVFDGSQAKVSVARGGRCRADGERATSSWAGRRTDRQRLAQWRSGPEESAGQVCSAVAGAAPDGTTSAGRRSPVTGDCLAAQRRDTPRQPSP